MNDVSHNIANESPDAIANRLINRAEYSDGLQEIAIGVLILTLVGVTLLQVVFKGSFGSKAFFWGILLLMPLTFGSQWAIKQVRRRFLIGKGGYVQLRPVNRKRLGNAIGRALVRTFVITALATFVGITVTI